MCSASSGARDRPERAGPGVQRQRTEDDPIVLQAAEQRFAEVQAGGRRGDGPGPAGVDRLIMLAVGLVHLALADVGRQGDTPNTPQQGEGLLVALGTHNPTAIGLLDAQAELNVVLPLGIGKSNRLVGHELSPRLAEDTPKAASSHLQEEALPVATRALATAQQPGGHHARVVQHKAIPGPKDLGQIANVVMRQRLLAAIDDQQAGIDPRGGRLLGDQVPRQFVVVLIELAHFNRV